jgi:GH35 family endo-1,4-beta-xylanase
MKTSRRQFLYRTTAGCTAAFALREGFLQAADSNSPAEAMPGRFTVHAYDAKGEPLAASTLQGLFLFESGGDRNPLRQPKRDVSNGCVSVEAPAAPFGCSLLTNVDGFGTVRLYADAEGRGYRAGQQIVLSRELASSRLAALEKVLAQAREEGVVLPPRVADRMERARSMLAQADAGASDPKLAAPLAMASLRELLWAGEDAVLARAGHAITRRGPRKGFLFGCNFFGYPEQGEAYAEKFAALFNFATLPLYWRSFEPEEGKPRFGPVDTKLARLEKSGITAKGHPLCWFHEAGCPTWMQGRSFEQWREEQRRRIAGIVGRYRERIRVYDVINEAHDWGNEPGFSQDQLLEMTRLAADAAHAADPKATRVINNCCLFGEYVAEGRTYKGGQPRPLRTPLQYLRAVLKAGVDFDAVGLQVYYPEHDLFEIARMLDRFAALGKPLHVTELGVSSRADRDEEAIGKDPGKSYWHAPWSEGIQADWIEQFYTLCYGHPAVKAVTWWDFSDAPGHFWPHGGFLRPDGQPKEGYQRLQRLIRDWTGARA